MIFFIGFFFLESSFQISKKMAAKAAVELKAAMPDVNPSMIPTPLPVSAAHPTTKHIFFTYIKKPSNNFKNLKKVYDFCFFLSKECVQLFASHFFKKNTIAIIKKSLYKPKTSLGDNQ
jgi:hypothetical protein